MRERHGAIYADLIGVPFAWGARGPEAFDCYGLVREMLRRAGEPCPPHDNRPEVLAVVAAEMADEIALGRWVAVPRRAGAVVLFHMPVVIAGQRRRVVAHCGFMVNDFEFIHAWAETGGVTVEHMHDWERRVAGFYTFTP